MDRKVIVVVISLITICIVIFAVFLLIRNDSETDTAGTSVGGSDTAFNESDNITSAQQGSLITGEDDSELSTEDSVVSFPSSFGESDDVSEADDGDIVFSQTDENELPVYMDE